MSETEQFYRIAKLPPYVFAVINELKAKARAAGQDVVDFGMGNPDGETPTVIVDKLVEAARQMKLLEQTNLLEAPSPEPRITLQLPEPGKIQLVLRFPAPDRGRSRVEQGILRRYLSERLLR